MFGLGFSELIVLAVLGLILLGPEQLPDMARTLGRFINDLKRSTNDLTEEFKKQGFSDMNASKLLEDIRRDIGEVPSPMQALNVDEKLPDHVGSPPVDETQPANAHETPKPEDDQNGKKPESN